MEAVGQLNGGLVHDFKHLPTGITGSLERLQKWIGQGRLAAADRYILAAHGAARRAAALTHRPLAFSRRQTLDPNPTDANRLIADMQELPRRTVGPSIELKKDLPDEINLRQSADAGRLLRPYQGDDHQSIETTIRAGRKRIVH